MLVWRKGQITSRRMRREGGREWARKDEVEKKTVETTTFTL